MKILVTGGAGFIGSNYIRSVLECEMHEVINLDALTYAGNRENVRQYEQNDRYTFVEGNITDATVVDRVMSQADCIVNFAAETHVDRSIVNAYQFAYTNVVGTLTLLEVAKRQGNKRFHHISTDEVFGSLGSDGVFNEVSSYNPRSPYAASKAGADHFVRAYFHTHGLPVTISHCSNNYGPSQHPEKFIAKAITDLIDGKDIGVYGNGKNIRDWIHVDDHVQGVQLALEKGVVGETYCFGGNAEWQNFEVAKKITEIMEVPESRITFIEDRKGHDFRYAVDSKKAEEELGWSRKRTFEEGLRETVRWYRANESWWRQLKKDGI